MQVSHTLEDLADCAAAVWTIRILEQPQEIRRNVISLEEPRSSDVCICDQIPCLCLPPVLFDACPDRKKKGLRVNKACWFHRKMHQACNQSKDCKILCSRYKSIMSDKQKYEMMCTVRGVRSRSNKYPRRGNGNDC
jgi:hypothetical protein